MKQALSSIRTLGLAAPLLIVLVLATALGFVAGRTVDGDPRDEVVRITVVEDTAEAPAPAPTQTPSPTPDGGSGRDPRCPAGCDCEFTPQGGSVILCGNRR